MKLAVVLNIDVDVDVDNNVDVDVCLLTSSMILRWRLKEAVNGAVNISTNHHIPVSAFTIFGIIHKVKRESKLKLSPVLRRGCVVARHVEGLLHPCEARYK